MNHGTNLTLYSNIKYTKIICICKIYREHNEQNNQTKFTKAHKMPTQITLQSPRSISRKIT